MKDIIDFKPLTDILEELYKMLPTVVGAILFIIFGWLCLKVILFVARKSLALTKIDSLAAKISEDGALFGSAVKIKPTKIILGFIKWFLILILVIIGSDLFGLEMVSEEVGKMIGYLPKIFSAVIIFGCGIYFASLLRKGIAGMLKSFDLNGSKVISLIVFYVIVVIVSVTALNQAGVNTDLITSNLSIIFGAFLASFAIALGLGSREIVLRLLLGFYSRKNFEIGQRVRVDEFEGTIVSIDNICMVVDNGDQKMVYPIKLISNKRVEVLS